MKINETILKVIKSNNNMITTAQAVEIYGGFAMSAKAMSLKEKIKNYAKSNKIAAQVVLQNYMLTIYLMSR